MWWNRLFRLDVVAVKGAVDEQGGQKIGVHRADRTRFPYEPRVIGGKLGCRPTFNESIKSSSTPRKWKLFPMRCVRWWKAYGPGWRTSCRSAQLEMALKLLPTGLGPGIDRTPPTRRSSLEWEIGASTKTMVVPTSALVLIAYRHRSDDPLGSHGDLRGS